MTPAVVVSCDDLGMHPTINEAIVELLAEGIVRSTSLMAVGNFFDDAVRRLERAGIGEVGVHLALGSEYAGLPTRPLSPPPEVPTLVRADGSFSCAIGDIRDSYSLAEVRAELTRQIERVQSAGLRVTHLDGHMFFYLPEEGGDELYALVRELAESLGGVPFRGGQPGPAAGATCFLWDETPAREDRVRRYAAWLSTVDYVASEVIIHPAKDPAQLRHITRSADWRYADYVAFRRATLQPLLRDRLEVVSWPELASRLRSS